MILGICCAEPQVDSVVELARRYAGDLRGGAGNGHFACQMADSSCEVRPK